MLKTILSRRQPQAEEINTEEQADFRARMNTTEKIFNLRILCETLPCPLRLQEGFWQGMARRPECCSVLFQKYSWSSTRMFTPTLLNIFLERIVCEVLDDHEGSVSIGGRLITNFCFADDTVVNTKEEEAQSEKAITAKTTKCWFNDHCAIKGPLSGRKIKERD